MDNRNIVFLYTELAQYFLACVQVLTKAKVQVHIVHWPVNEEAPFNFSDLEKVTFHQRSDHTDPELRALIQVISPSLIICSGWIDKGYIKICRDHFGKCPTVLTMDNHWNGSVKQRIAVIGSRFLVHSTYSHAWVPGRPQQEYAMRLGFKPQAVTTRFYCADIGCFERVYHKRQEQAVDAFPKRFIFVGRYVRHKGVFDLWRAFLKLHEKVDTDWELWCFGAGEEFENRIEHPRIRHFGFVQPDDLTGYLNQTGVFVLPSYFEPWGVVIHEFAGAGFPIVCSDQVGAATEFVENEVNGFIYPVHEKDALFNTLLKVIHTPTDALLRMGKVSFNKAQTITPRKWAQTVVDFLS